MFRNHPTRHVIAGLALAAAFCLAVGVPLYAQTTSASVSGIVKDAGGLVLPGVSVALVNTSRGTEQTVVSDERGDFLFPLVQPGTYTLKLSLPGFQTLEKTNVVVNANDRLMAGNFTLTLGQLTESVVVTGVSSDIQLKSGERGYTLQSAAIQNIAVNGRSFFGLAGLVPGVIPNSDAPTQVSNLNANGQRSNSNNMTIDGVANIDTGDNGGNMAQTNLDAIAEFRILTSAYQAEFGRAVGAQVQVVTKSGGRNFSGSGYWYARRSDWNENTWINKRSGTPLATSSRNDTGFTIGGPVLPLKNLFFFFSQEFQRREDPVGETRVTVPTDLERAGNFSQSVDSNGNLFPYIRDYTTGLPCSASNTAGCFQDGGVLGKIPANRLYAPTLAALSIFPKANTAGQVGYNYKSQTPSSAPLNQTMVRLDYQLNNNWRMYRAVHVPHQQVRAAVWHRRLVGAQQHRHPQRHLGRARPQLDGVVHRHSQQHDVARDFGRQRTQLSEPHREQRSVHEDRRRHVEPADALHHADPGRPAAPVELRWRPDRQSGLSQFRPGAIHQLQHDV